MQTHDTPPDTSAVVARCADLVADRFVLPDVGERAATRLRERATAGAYGGLDPASLAVALSTDLQDVAHDLHLRVIHHPDGVPPTQDPAAYEDYWREIARTTAGGMRRVERLAGNEPARLVDIDSRVEGLRQRWTHPVATRRFGPDRPLVVLTSATTFSGGEEVAFDVQLLGRGEVVGERTRGGANPREGVAVHPELELAVPVARALSPQDGSSWEGVGVQPDVECPAGEALERGLALLRRA